jgi:hypothetical protein
MQLLEVYASLGVVITGCGERHKLGRLWGRLSKRRRASRKDVEPPAELALTGVDRVSEPAAIRILRAHPLRNG